MTDQPASSAGPHADGVAVDVGGGDDFSKLDPHLRFIERKANDFTGTTTTNDDVTMTTNTQMIHWPCLLFDNPKVMSLALSQFKTTRLYTPFRNRQVSEETLQLIMKGLWSSKSKLPVAFLLGDWPPAPEAAGVGDKTPPPRLIFAPPATSLSAIDGPLIAFSDQLEMFLLQENVNGKFFQSALEEMIRIMRNSSQLPTFQDYQESTLYEAAGVGAQSSSRQQDMGQAMEIDAIKPAAAAAAVPSTTTTFMHLPTWESTTTTTTTTVPGLACKATHQHPQQPAQSLPTWKDTTTMPGLNDQQLQPHESFATDTSLAAAVGKTRVQPQGHVTVAAPEHDNPTGGHPHMAPTAAAPERPAVASKEKHQKDVVAHVVAGATTTAAGHLTTTTTEDHQSVNKPSTSSTSVKTAASKDGDSTIVGAALPPAAAQEENSAALPQHDGRSDDDDMPMADEADDDDENNHKHALLHDQVMKSAESNRKRTDASEKESVLVEATRPTSTRASTSGSKSSSSESVLVQSTRLGVSTRKSAAAMTTTSKKVSRPKKSSSTTISTTSDKHKTPSQPNTRNRRNSLTPSNLALGKLGTTAKKSTSRSCLKPPSDKKITLRSFSTIKELLQKGGYSFGSNLYCRPFMNPQTNPNAVLGRDYFESLEAFRQDLCAYGVDDYADWTAEDRETIETWVRLTVVKSVDLDKVSWPEHDALSPLQALRILRDLEYRTTLTQWGANTWLLPCVSPKEGVMGKTMFMDEKSLWNHLYRFGLSANISRDKVDNQKLISLEMFMSQPRHHILDTFERLPPTPMDDEAPTGARSSRKKRSSMPSSGLAYSASTSATSVSARASGSMSTSKKRSIEASSSSLVSSKKQKSARAHAVAKTPYPPIEPTWAPEDSPPPASTVMNLHNSTSTVVTADSFSPRESRELPVIQGTDRERLVACIEALKQTNDVDHFSYGNGESRFEQNLNRVTDFLRAAIGTQGGHGGRPGDPTALYICGVPGIGKTSGVKWCCNKMIQEVEKGNIGVEGDWQPRLCEINATRLQNVKDPMKDLIESVTKALGLQQPSLFNVERILKRGGLLMLVVDEMDTLVSVSKSGNGGKPTASERVVQKLLEWTSDETMGVAVIGISNSTGNDKYCRLQELGKFKETLTFNAYGVLDIISILEGRIGRSVMDENAMQFIGRKISNDSGDARKALKLAAKAVQICLDKLGNGDKTTPGPIVKTVHAHLANRSTQERLNERIEGLPTFTKGILCVLSTLSHERSIAVTCGILRGFCASCMSQDDIPTADDFRVSIETLQEMGLLRMNNVHAERAFGPGASIMALDSAPVRLGVQSEDVESAIVQELGQKAFFMRMRELALAKKEELIYTGTSE